MDISINLKTRGGSNQKQEAGTGINDTGDNARGKAEKVLQGSV